MLKHKALALTLFEIGSVCLFAGPIISMVAGGISLYAPPPPTKHAGKVISFLKSEDACLMEVVFYRIIYYSGVGLYVCGILCVMVLMYLGKDLFRNDDDGDDVDEDAVDEKLPEYTEKDM